MRLLVATTNRHKVEEIRPLLGGLSLAVATLDSWPMIPPPEEAGRTFEENARLKATYYAGATGELTVAEDSGLEIDALGGAPGVQSARYGGEAKTYPEKFALLYRELGAVDAADTSEVSARYVCAVALARADQILFEARGIVEGWIAREPRGSGGFGYDPIFFYPPYGRTFGEVSVDEKAAVSHRAAAFRKLRQFVETATSVL